MLLNEVCTAIRLPHLDLSTEHLYLYHVEDYIRFHKLQHPRDMRLTEITAYLPEDGFTLFNTSDTE
ncbi:MAG: phage integrase N-terminal SAM-like domain-containing protein [Deinococcales bacterium]